MSASVAAACMVGVGLSVLSPWFLLFLVPLGISLYISVIVGLSPQTGHSGSRRSFISENSPESAS